MSFPLNSFSSSLWRSRTDPVRSSSAPESVPSVAPSAADMVATVRGCPLRPQADTSNLTGARPTGDARALFVLAARAPHLAHFVQTPFAECDRTFQTAREASTRSGRVLPRGARGSVRRSRRERARTVERGASSRRVGPSPVNLIRRARSALRLGASAPVESSTKMGIFSTVGSFLGGNGSAAADGTDGEPDAKRVKREDGDAEGGEAGAAGAGTRGNNPGDANGGTSTSGAGVGSKPEDLGQYAMREIHLRKQEDDGELVYMVIKNDGEEQNLVWLITLKNIFSKQLPNMPKEYIVRLVLNPNHHSMICLKNGQVIGGITYRPFWRQKMAEIAFCAVSASEQVKGYGTRLMNHLKEYVCEKENMTHLITFADNNAVGYFQKQGFTKDVMMEREKWVGYIKEYDGGTIMECALSAQVSYTDFPVMIRQQRKAVDEKVRELSSAHVVYPGARAL